MILATFNWFQIPYVLAFSGFDSNIFWIDIINGIIDFIFLIDIFINFRKTYFRESKGEEITNLVTIAIKYAKGELVLDLLAWLPIDIIVFGFQSSRHNYYLFKLVGLLKFSRVLRLSKLITYLNLTSNVKMTLKMINLIFFIILFVHWLAWFWFYVVSRQDSWCPPLNGSYCETEFYQKSQFSKYWVS